MKLRIAWIQPRPGKAKLSAITQLTDEYLSRLRKYIAAEPRELTDEAAVKKETAAASGRTHAVLVLLDSRGKLLSSEELADFIRDHQDRGTQALLFAIGGPDGFTAEMRKSADAVISFGKITLPHELARVVLLEQLYRAFTILRGHPYHCGH